MHHHWGWPVGPASPGLLFVHMIFWGLANLFWIGLLGTLFWAALRSYRSPQDQSALPSAQDSPSALELLRRRYVVGQIDIETFGELVVPLLELEESEPIYKLSPPTERKPEVPNWS